MAGARWRDWLFILQWFALTRLALTLVGLLAQALFAPFMEGHYVWIYSDHAALDLWALWDSGWYFSVARFGYEAVSPAHPDVLSLPHAGNWGFYPLYPALIALLQPLVRSPLLAGLIVSNAAFLVSCKLLLSIVARRTDAETARRALRFLFVFPATFIFSGVFSEAVCFLALLAFTDAAARGAHGRAGIYGFLLSLARPVGPFVALSLAVEWWRGGAGRAGRSRLHPRALFLLGPVLGVLAWLAFNELRTGDPFAFAVVKGHYWQAGLHEPFSNALAWLRDPDPTIRINAGFAFAQLAAMSALLWQRRFDWFVLTFSLWAVPIGGGGVTMATGVLRYAILAYPYSVLLADASRDPRVERALLVAFAILQGLLMATWATGLHFVV